MRADAADAYSACPCNNHRAVNAHGCLQMPAAPKTNTVSMLADVCRCSHLLNHHSVDACRCLQVLAPLRTHHAIDACGCQQMAAAAKTTTLSMPADACRCLQLA